MGGGYSGQRPVVRGRCCLASGHRGAHWLVHPQNNTLVPQKTAFLWPAKVGGTST